MDELAVVQAIEQWRRTRDEQSLSLVVQWLESWLPIPPAVARVLGASEVEAVRTEVMEDLLAGPQPLSPAIQRPRAFAVTVFRNRMRDRLRARARQPDVDAPGVAETILARSHARPVPNIERQLEAEQLAQRVLEELKNLKLEERVALLLLHAVDRLSEEDWQEVVKRHEPPPPPRPDELLDRSAIAALLHPDLPPSRAYERTGKLIQRLYRKLRRVMDAAETITPEEDP